MVVAQLVERSLSITEVRARFDSSHRQNVIEHLLIINCIEKTKINKKEAGNGPLFFKKSLGSFIGTVCLT